MASSGILEMSDLFNSQGACGGHLWARMSLFQDLRDSTPPLQSSCWRKREATVVDSLGVGWILQLLGVGGRPGCPLENCHPDGNWQDIAAALTVGPWPFGWCSSKVGTQFSGSERAG